MDLCLTTNDTVIRLFITIHTVSLLALRTVKVWFVFIERFFTDFTNEPKIFVVEWRYGKRLQFVLIRAKLSVRKFIKVNTQLESLTLGHFSLHAARAPDIQKVLILTDALKFLKFFQVSLIKRKFFL